MWFSSSDTKSFWLRISSAFIIWRHWSTWTAWCWMYLGTSSEAPLFGTRVDCGELSGRWKSFPITVHYVAGWFASPMIPCFPPLNSDYMVDMFACILQFILRMILWSMTPLHFFIFLKSNLLQISSYLSVIVVYFGFTEFGVLECFRIDFTEFGVLNFSGNRQNPLFLCIGSGQTFLCLFFLSWVEVAMPVSGFILFSHGSCTFSFLVDPVPCFSCFVWFTSLTANKS